MQFFYTGADTYQRPQTIAEKSLGGWMSITPVPNGRINNIWSDESYRSFVNGNVDTKAIVLENILGTALTGVKLGFLYPTGYLSEYKIEIALVTLQAPNFQKMEQITSSTDTPFYGNFIEASQSPIDNSLVIGNFAAGQRLGIWIRRTLLSQTSPSCSALQPLQNVNEKIINVKFNLTWD